MYGDLYGAQVVLAGSRALVGAPGDDTIGNDNDNGTARILVLDSGYGWHSEAFLSASDGAAYDRFGTSLALSGDTALVGTPSDSVGGVNSGSVSVFTRSGSVWTEQGKLTASDGASYNNFGVALALSGDTLLVGADGGGPGSLRSGAVYVLVQSGGTWTEQAKLTATRSGRGSTGIRARPGLRARAGSASTASAATRRAAGATTTTVRRAALREAPPWTGPAGHVPWGRSAATLPDPATSRRCARAWISRAPRTRWPRRAPPAARRMERATWPRAATVRARPAPRMPRSRRAPPAAPPRARATRPRAATA
ncbi:PKD domain containing protein [Chondromyces apiculatus DSM 436]|uniref:PKD domain containing protein n=1 Tax=Chondromyces apiculatus DSM 436 TaxID=1192034 RepID=A0A017TIS1_9BACT|nr:PKD domain containing protein [Chondromyces apiculatus DSM 436]